MTGRSGRKDEFYVGWQPSAPRRTALWVRGVVLALVGLGSALAVLLPVLQSPFSQATFEFGVERRFEGVVRARPWPVLLVPRPGSDDGFSTYLLTAFGKHGAGPLLEPFDGRVVRLAGSLIRHDGQAMIEVRPQSIESLEGAAAETLLERVRSSEDDLGTMTLTGEVVDSKCFLGVMKPGSGKAHRDCAARCISGGVPALLMVRDARGHAAYFLLADSEGDAVGRAVLPFVGESVTITGRVVVRDELYVLEADVAGYRRAAASES